MTYRSGDSALPPSLVGGQICHYFDFIWMRFLNCISYSEKPGTGVFWHKCLPVVKHLCECLLNAYQPSIRRNIRVGPNLADGSFQERM